jgi:AraC family transcriptional regulator, regulatory protein of adaptative response / DNA-3-methyladenine glycosylase II
MKTMKIELEYISPFEWNPARTLLVGRAGTGVQIMDGERYVRTLAIENHRGWISVAHQPDKNALLLELSEGLAPVAELVQKKVRRAFDLDANPMRIAAHLGTLAEARPGLRLPGSFDGYETAVRAILGQQISVQSASTLAGRFAAAFGEQANTPFAGLTHLTPTAERVAQAKESDLIPLGIIAARARSLIALSEAVASGKLSLQPDADPETMMAELCRLPGIGEWTAHWVAMRVQGYADAFPHSDLGIKKALGETNLKRILEAAEPWRPYRAYATIHLWNSLNSTPSQ